tara:strand:+ start:31 stop:1128 length:1098 start_codon:yes stop_codon:yes gene_type:complete
VAIDWSTILDPKEAFNLIFKGDEEGADAYGCKCIFQAEVLTSGRPITVTEARALQSAFMDRDDDDLEGKRIDNIEFKRMSFKGRILGEDSPHNFIPDPGNLNYSENPENVARVVAMYTTFVTTKDYKEDVTPQIGDVYTVSLRASHDNGIFNLQVGDALYRSSTADSPTSKERERYESLGKSFEGVPVYYGTGDVMEIAGVQVENGKLPDSMLAKVDERYSQPGVLLKDIVGMYNSMTKAFMERFGTKFPLSQTAAMGFGGYRSYEDQVRIKEQYTKVGEGHKAAYPGTSNHGWGLAFDFVTMDQNGSDSFNSEYYEWMTENVGDFHNPSWALEGGTNPEAWHWEPTQVSYDTNQGYVVADAVAE